jgi:AraC-like DNA-binding protein
MNPVYAGSQPGPLQRAITEFLGPFRLRPGPDGVRARVAAARSSDVTLGTLEVTGPLHADTHIGPTAAYHVVLAPGDNVDVRVDEAEPVRGPHVLGPGQHVSVSWRSGPPVLYLRLSRSLIERAWREQGMGRRGGSPRFEVPLDPVAAGARLWETLAESFLASWNSGVLGPGNTATVDAQFGQLLAHALMQSQPPASETSRGSVRAPAEEGRKDALPAGLRRARDFCDAHAHEPLTVARIAAAAGLSVRTLQAVFRAQLDLTPLEYVRRIRLARVHGELMDIREGVTQDTVSAVATRWGFNHLGRFSALYRSEFGQLPSQAVRRR